MYLSRRGFSLFDLLMLIALFALGFAMFLPAIGAARLDSARRASENNLRQIGLGVHSYHDVNSSMPAGVDKLGFSAAAYILPYLEQDNVAQKIDFKKAPTDKANAAMRAVVIKTFVNPLDPVKNVTTDAGPTNYLFCAGDQASLSKNNGAFYAESKVGILRITDGTSNTLMVGETLKGDGGVKATNVARQHVALKAEFLNGFKPETGINEWKNDTNIAADRGMSWMEGRFLQGTFTGTRMVDDPSPDVDCGGQGGASGLRSAGGSVFIALCDGSTRKLSNKVDLKIIRLLTNGNDGQPIPDF